MSQNSTYENDHTPSSKQGGGAYIQINQKIVNQKHLHKTKTTLIVQILTRLNSTNKVVF